MNICDCKQWISDIDKVTASLPELDKLAGKTILITGATGLICSAVVDIFLRYNDTHKNDMIRILAAGRSQEKMSERFGLTVDRPDFGFVHFDASSPDIKITDRADYIIHGASNASPNMIVEEPVETMMSNIFGMKSLLDYAKQSMSRRVLFVSSSEVYGKKDSDEPYKEGDYGYIDLLNPRNSYSISKCATETLCISYYDEYGIESVIVRPGHIYGPTASPEDIRVSSAWAYQASRGDDIIMKSDGSQVRSYVYSLDCASAIIKVLTIGENCSAYNISNPDSIISIKELGEILAEAGGVNVKMVLPSEKEKKSFNPMKNSSLEASKLMDLGWRGCFTANDGLNHTVSILKELRNQ